MRPSAVAARLKDRPLVLQAVGQGFCAVDSPNTVIFPAGVCAASVCGTGFTAPSR
jgi:hypothetical protein